MTSFAQIRDPKTDTLVAPGNAVVLFIDYQPPQIAAVKSHDQAEMVANAVRTAKLAKLFGLPIILSTVNVASGAPPTVERLADAFADILSAAR